MAVLTANCRSSESPPRCERFNSKPGEITHRGGHPFAAATSGLQQEEAKPGDIEPEELALPMYSGVIAPLRT
jgi:hypothetical protein